MLRHVGYPEEKCENVCFNCGKSCGFSLLTRIHNTINFRSNFWLYVNLNSVSWIVQPFTYEEIDLDVSHLAATTQKTAGHGTRDALRG